jgi:hypothetical protein
MLISAFLSNRESAYVLKCKQSRVFSSGLPPGTVVSLMAHTHEIAGSVTTGSSNKFEVKLIILSSWLEITKCQGA